MPKEGFKSLTIKAGVYDAMARIYKKHEIELGRKGVNSMSSFATRIFYDVVEEKGDHLAD